ncbi:hypothetical protein IEQ34_013270 [Dendrobium chrysotoxum]|uniref:Uncharacterized protein n=1 Tax=Dendrobium chrysotoxum TaxID=161865 RepID=A0AAV7GR43_DENCH|nr:hypothetical protein IEQ34_013270 [Dendrobium chrysotoxum]
MSDAVDYKGFPADKAKTGGWIPAALILGIEICERLSTMGIAVNLVTYLIGTMHLPSAESANAVTEFMGTSFMLCLLGGFLADSFLGRYLTIAIFAAFQALGTGLLALATKLPQLRPTPCNSDEQCNRATRIQLGMLYFCLYIIALGTGGLKSSVSGFGTDQFDETDEKEKTQMSYFFNRFFFFISTGTLLAVTVLVYMQEEVGRSWAYGICSVAMVVAIGAFLSGTKRYRYKKRFGSPVVYVIQVLVAALRKRNVVYKPGVSCFYEDQIQDNKIHHTNQFCFLDKAAIMEESDYSDPAKANNDEVNWSLNRSSWRLCSVTRVEEVKMMIRLLPVWATTILFWTIYAQMITFSVEQAITMERSIGKNFQIPAGSSTVFLVGAILATLAVYDRIVMPWWKKCKGTTGFNNFQKISIGLFLSAIGMVVAALVERRRLVVARQVETTMTTTQKNSRDTLPISVFILIPQFLLVGTAEAFVYTGQLDFFITQSPKGMKTMSTGLFLSTISLGFFLSSLLVSIIKTITGGKKGNGWLGDNINNGRLDCFYGFLAVLSMVNLAAFIFGIVWKRQKSNEEAADDKC